MSDVAGAKSKNNQINHKLSPTTTFARFIRQQNAQWSRYGHELSERITT
jgi:hypothetical protein